MISAPHPVIHITTVHLADDVRIFERECRSLVTSGHYAVSLAAHGSIPSDSGITKIDLPRILRHRLPRMLASQLSGLILSTRQQADIWHIHDPEMLPTALLLKCMRRTVIWDAHEDYWSQFEINGSKSWAPNLAKKGVKAMLSALLNLTDRHVDAVVAATPFIATKYSNPDVVLVGNEARVSDFATCRPTFASRTLLFVGSLTRQQSFPQVVEALTRLPDVTLAVAGRTPDDAQWNWVLSQLPGRATHLGWLGREQLRETIDMCALGLVTYSDTEAHATNMGNKLFEFAAAGLPVVATPTLSNLTQIDEGGFGVICDGFDSDNIRTAIQNGLSDFTEWSRQSANARRWALAHGSYEGSEKRLLSLYDRLIATQNRNRNAMPAGLD